jgi:hypothetical protein
MALEGKIKTQGEEISCIFSQLKYADTVTKKIVSAGKIWFDFPLAIFSPQYTVCESRKIIAWPKGEKIKTQGEKISYIFPQLKYADTVTKKIVSAGKIWFDFPLAIFSPQYTVCESRKIIAWPKGEK